MLKDLIEVTKPKQTFLLMVTFVVAYMVAGGDFENFLPAFVATTLAVAGTTALNMFLDKDIDVLMPRTRLRPLPSGRLKPDHCLIYGVSLFAAGIAIAMPNQQLALVLFLGMFFDIVVYTILLKRRSPYSILFGGVAGAMPALAGWVAAKGFSLGGLLLAAIVFLWIPSHIWYISMYYADDYRRAGIPMYPLVVGMERASWVIVASTAAMLLAIASLYVVLEFNVFCLVVAITVTAFFLYRAVKFAVKPERYAARRMYKLASFTLGAIYTSILIGTFI
ncbi:MAG: heme o synthase [Archaeoglobaceae archaeon]